LVVTPGSGPRHLVFAVKDTKTFMYLVTELANTIVGYEVVYGGKFIAFKEIWSGGIHGKGKDVPQGAAAAEIAISVSEFQGSPKT
jgi:6-phosphogluconolactonase (cycloisomerase 2 family)